MTFWNVFFGVFAGIVAGIFINLAISAIKNYNTQKKLINNLKYEIEFNLKKIDAFLEEFREYRKHINGKSPYDYFGIIHMTGLLKTTLEQMFSDRSIYKYFDNENIGRLQTFYSDIQPDTVKRVNDQIQEFREISYESKMVKTVNKYIDYLEAGLRGNKENLQAVKMKRKSHIFRKEQKESKINKEGK